MRFTRKRLAILGGVIAVAAAIAVPVALGATFYGTLSPGDATQTDRLFRDGVPSNCYNGKTDPGLFAGAGKLRDTRTFYNPTPKWQCVQVRLTHTNSPSAFNAFVQANAPFVAATPNANYLGDAGQSGSPEAFSFWAAPFSYFDVTVNEVYGPGVGISGYTLTVNIGNPAKLAPTFGSTPKPGAVDHR